MQVGSGWATGATLAALVDPKRPGQEQPLQDSWRISSCQAIAGESRAPCPPALVLGERETHITPLQPCAARRRERTAWDTTRRLRVSIVGAASSSCRPKLQIGGAVFGGRHGPTEYVLSKCETVPFVSLAATVGRSCTPAAMISTTYVNKQPLRVQAGVFAIAGGVRKPGAATARRRRSCQISGIWDPGSGLVLECLVLLRRGSWATLERG